MSTCCERINFQLKIQSCGQVKEGKQERKSKQLRYSEVQLCNDEQDTNCWTLPLSKYCYMYMYIYIFIYLFIHYVCVQNERENSNNSRII